MSKGWAVVTGASSGIGMTFARELARHGDPVLAVARPRERLEALAREAAEQGGQVEALTADLIAEQGDTSAVRRIEELGEIELLFNNAGIANADDFLESSLIKEIDTFLTNPGLLGKLPSLTAEQVVKAGPRALDHGRVVKVVGGLNQFLPFMARLRPRRTVRWLMRVSVKRSGSLRADKAGR